MSAHGKIPFYKPSLPSYRLVEEDFGAAYRSGMLAPGKYTERLVEAVREHTGVRYVVPFSNCSDGLIALLGPFRGLTVALPAFTFSATWQAADWNGCSVVAVDIDECGQMDPTDLRRVLTTHDIDVILPVHMFGNPSHVDAYEKLALDYDCVLLYDCAHGMGAYRNGVSLGGFGHAEVMSIGTTKCLPAGEGGLILTNDIDICRHMELAAIHGHHPPTPYDSNLDVLVPSLNGRIQEVNSIIAYHGLSILGDSICRRNEIANIYDSLLEDIAIVKVDSGNTCSYKDYPIRVGKDREEKLGVIRQLHDAFGISTKEYYYPAIPDLAQAMNPTSIIINSRDGFSRARGLAATAMSLPIYPALTDEEAIYIAAAVRTCLIKEIA
jgi:dTDP-4-amino-4,6-dideoxygalactose transaminase